MKKHIDQVDTETGEIITVTDHGRHYTGKDEINDILDEGLPIVKNSLNYHLYPKKYEENDQPSQTIPSQSMSIKEILQRYARGLPVMGNAEKPIYEEDGIELPDLRKMDISEREELRLWTIDKIAENRKKLQQDTERKIAREQEEFNKWRTKQREAQSNNQSNKDQIPADLQQPDPTTKPK